ncbi:hypothetical protein EVAR_41792_1 [Eumeta japonica]|uniref:Uncharacterized protein n=1 Tax=Eumeta variegata TaxID=151549 RepID=A0A4C1W1K1_EUMVA|nr:hypothetical protein EVAR_41792_1 [Eumeta japonica]
MVLHLQKVEAALRSGAPHEPATCVRGAIPFGAEYAVVGGRAQGHPDLETQITNIGIRERLDDLQLGSPEAPYFLSGILLHDHHFGHRHGIRPLCENHFQ